MLTKPKALEKLRNLGEELREYYDFKSQWVSEKNDAWQNSAEGFDWIEHLDAIEAIVDQIEDLPYS